MELIILRDCCRQENAEICSILSSLENVSQFVLKKFVTFSTMHFTALFVSKKALKYLNLFDCKLRNHLMMSLCNVLNNLLHLHHIILSGNNTSKEVSSQYH